MKVIWTDFAKSQLKEIYLYYKEVASVKVAHSIEQKIFIKTRKLSRNHQLGQEVIVWVFDTRRDPGTLKLN